MPARKAGEAKRNEERRATETNTRDREEKQNSSSPKNHQLTWRMYTLRASDAARV